MPRKLRTDKRRTLDAYAGAEAWADVFQCGHAIFDDFTDLTGVELETRTAPNGTPMRGLVPPIAAIEQAWKEFGPAYIAWNGRETCQGRPLWALEQFGEPAHG